MKEREIDITPEQETAGFVSIHPTSVPLNIARPSHAGDTCPKCGKGKLDYDGMLNLSCLECGYSLGGCFT
jgi:uncharacterized protein (DUF983 family)